MEMLLPILPAILIPLAISVILPWIYRQSKKEEAEDGVVTKTKYPKRFTLCSLISLFVTVALFVTVTIIICIFEKDFPVHSWIAFILSAMFFIAIPLSLTLLAFCTYEIICNDGILVARIFKKKFIKFSEMASYHYVFGQLTVYDNNHKEVFGVYDNRVGMKALLEQLEYRGVFRE